MIRISWSREQRVAGRSVDHCGKAVGAYTHIGFIKRMDVDLHIKPERATFGANFGKTI
jgi:hypothetical protein